MKVDSAAVAILVALSVSFVSVDAVLATNGDSPGPGADLTDCGSALHVGPQYCEQYLTRTETPVSIADTREAREMEDRVDAYLANFGKPPREAVRALLDPSDHNIRELLRMQQEKLALVAYVAARMTALQTSEGRPLNLAQTDPSAFLQMHISLVQRPRDPDARAALHALRDLARQVPALQAGVTIVGHFESAQLRGEITGIDTPLSVAVATPDSVAADQLPFLRIDDLRNQRVLVLDARTLTSADQLRETIVALRANAAQGTAQRVPGPADQGAP
jgi:hypothetical protein